MFGGAVRETEELMPLAPCIIKRNISKAYQYDEKWRD